MTTFAGLTAGTICVNVRELSSESPDAIYGLRGSGCRYASGSVSNGSCGCIVGQAVRRSGHDPEPLDNARSFPVSATIALQRLLEPGSWEWEELQWLRCVQLAQDDGVAWGLAVVYADTNCPKGR
jgi:hypothetical protein